MNKAFPGLVGAVVVLALALGAQAGAALGWMALLGRHVDLTLLAGLANLTALTAVAALGYWWSGEGPNLRPRARPALWAAVTLTAAGGSVVLGEVANLTAWLVPLPPPLAALFNTLTEGPAPLALFTVALVAPFTEEALFRGLLFRGFDRRYGFWPALLLSSALFALFHLNLWQALPAFAAGLYLGWLFQASGSLLFPMAAHGLFNGLPVALGALGLTITGYNSPARVGVPEFQPLVWTLAGAAVLALGLWLTSRWAPLSARPVSDTVAP